MDSIQSWGAISPVPGPSSGGMGSAPDGEFAFGDVPFSDQHVIGDGLQEMLRDLGKLVLLATKRLPSFTIIEPTPTLQNVLERVVLRKSAEAHEFSNTLDRSVPLQDLFGSTVSNVRSRGFLENFAGRFGDGFAGAGALLSLGLDSLIPSSRAESQPNVIQLPLNMFFLMPHTATAVPTNVPLPALRSRVPVRRWPYERFERKPSKGLRRPSHSSIFSRMLTILTGRRRAVPETKLGR